MDHWNILHYLLIAAVLLFVGYTFSWRDGAR